MSRVVDAWNRFWWTEQSPIALAVFRILFAVCLAVEVPTAEARALPALADAFHLPYASFVPVPSAEGLAWIHLANYPLIALLGLGLFTRFALVSLLVLQGWVLSLDTLIFRNHPYFFLIVFGVLLFSPCADALSFDAWRRRRRGRPPPARSPRAAQRLLQVQLSLIYFFAALQKLNTDYLHGRVLSLLFERSLKRSLAKPMIESTLGPGPFDGLLAWVAQPEHLVLVSLASVATELFLVLALWFRRTRALGLSIGVAFHLGIALGMDIWTFTGAVFAAYLLFLEPSTWERWRAFSRARLRAIRRRTGSPRARSADPSSSSPERARGA